MGSLQGILRIYCPRTKGGNHEDMMLEYQTDSPILGLATGEIGTVGWVLTGTICNYMLHGS